MRIDSTAESHPKIIPPPQQKPTAKEKKVASILREAPTFLPSRRPAGLAAAAGDKRKQTPQPLAAPPPKLTSAKVSQCSQRMVLLVVCLACGHVHLGEIDGGKLIDLFNKFIYCFQEGVL